MSVIDLEIISEEKGLDYEGYSFITKKINSPKHSYLV